MRTTTNDYLSTQIPSAGSATPVIKGPLWRVISDSVKAPAYRVCRRSFLGRVRINTRVEIVLFRFFAKLKRFKRNAYTVVVRIESNSWILDDFVCEAQTTNRKMGRDALEN